MAGIFPTQEEIDALGLPQCFAEQSPEQAAAEAADYEVNSLCDRHDGYGDYDPPSPDELKCLAISQMSASELAAEMQRADDYNLDDYLRELRFEQRQRHEAFERQQYHAANAARSNEVPF